MSEFGSLRFITGDGMKYGKIIDKDLTPVSAADGIIENRGNSNQRIGKLSFSRTFRKTGNV